MPNIFSLSHQLLLSQIQTLRPTAPRQREVTYSNCSEVVEWSKQLRSVTFAWLGGVITYLFMYLHLSKSIIPKSKLLTYNRQVVNVLRYCQVLSIYNIIFNAQDFAFCLLRTLFLFCLNEVPTESKKRIEKKK